MYCTALALSSHKAGYRTSFTHKKINTSVLDNPHSTASPLSGRIYSELLVYIGSLTERGKAFKFKPDGPYHIGGLGQLIYLCNLFKHLPGEVLRQNLLPPPAIFGLTKSKAKSFCEMWNSSHWLPDWCHWKGSVQPCDGCSGKLPLPGAPICLPSERASWGSTANSEHPFVPMGPGVSECFKGQMLLGLNLLTLSQNNKVYRITLL